MTETSKHRTSSRPTTRRTSLQSKVVGFLLIISMVPLAVAAVLINKSAEVAHNFASHEAAFLRPPLHKARSVYLELIASKRDLYYPQVALRLAALPEIVALAGGDADQHPLAVDAMLDELLAATRELAGITIRGPKGEVIASRQSLLPAAVRSVQWREIPVEAPIAGTGATLVLAFAADLELQMDYAQLNRALQDAQHIEEIRSALPSSYRMAFLLLVGGVVVVVSFTGIWLARRFTRRIYALVTGTRRVAAGDLNARVDLFGRDELAELAWAFNRMVEDIEHDREQIVYLQRVGAWQDVARKLAHEIKNPLTPIQLAVQQCVSSYKGDDERFRRLLRDTEEIVTEEISSLRRLVDAFRTLGQLPRVDARPMALTTVVDDLTHDPMLIEHLELDPPDEQVMIRGDRMLLRRVLTNLVENGVHAGRGAGRSGKVVVGWRADHEAGRVRLRVDDEGPGVPEEQREKIFEPYITHKEQGTGLGLTISKKIALEHGGTLELSRDPSAAGGARFVLSLPLAGEDAELGAAATS
jgi:two-component system, NtrC family, nitrogen regulation sensor histidine kinase NtrY